MSGQDRYDDNDPVTDIDGNVIPGMTKGQSRWIDDRSGLYFHLQKLKRLLRLKLVDDLVRMKAENATDDELIERIQNHHNTRTLMRDLHNVVTENDCAMAPVSRHLSYCRLIGWCDRAGVPAEYVEHLLWLRPLTSEEVAEHEAEEKRMHESAREAEAYFAARQAERSQPSVDRRM